MNATHKPQSEFAKELKDAKSKVEIGAKYCHYKNKDNYLVLAIGFLEANDEPCVIYQAQYGENIIFVRALSVWLEDVEFNNEIVPRFVKIED